VYREHMVLNPPLVLFITRCITDAELSMVFEYTQSSSNMDIFTFVCRDN